MNNDRWNADGKLPASLLRPPVFESVNEYPVFRAGMDYRRALGEMEKHGGILVKGSFPTALKFYSWLKNRIAAANPARDFLSSRKTKQTASEKTRKILVRVNSHQIDLEKAPPIPWLRSFYPENHDFLIPLPDLLGMNGAWQWYEKGISYPAIPWKLHPFYGVYFPVRTGHLTMFDEWLAQKGKSFRSASDIGTGCGILGFIMASRGIGKIYGTDINPNAVYSTGMEIERLGLQDRFEIEQASFFGSAGRVNELAVFNPPWIPGKGSSITDTGIYYDRTFFDTFFSEAEKMLAPGATLVLIFSNFAIEAGITAINPVEKALGQSRCFLLAEKITAKAREKPAVPPKGWMDRIRENEKIELWVLQRANR